MEIDLFQSSILAVVQGLTEFLPISSSAHLLLPSQLLGWPDQGMAFDVAVHFGSLLAVLMYFRRDLRDLFVAWLYSLGSLLSSQSAVSAAQRSHASLAWLLLLATLPAGLAGFFGQQLLEDYARDGRVLAVTSIGFALLLWWADSSGNKIKQLGELNWRGALLIGFAQALALIPGTSRSGVTMTAALMLGFSREAATRFSFLLAIPIILASGGLQAFGLIGDGISAVQWQILISATAISGVVAFMCIHFFLQLIGRVGFLPFVIYRILLGLLILVSLWL